MSKEPRRRENAFPECCEDAERGNVLPKYSEDMGRENALPGCPEDAGRRNAPPECLQNFKVTVEPLTLMLTRSRKTREGGMHF